MKIALKNNLIIILFNLIFIGFCILWDWPQWWVNINYEQSALGWLQGVELFVIGLVVLITELHSKDSSLFNRVFELGLGCGFIFLAMDERFQFHERLRDYLKIHQSGMSLIPGVEKGNYLLLVYAAVGLLFSIHLIKKAWRKKYVYFYILALLLALIAVAMDAPATSHLTLESFRLEQFIEELFESATETCFILFFWNRYLDHAK